MTLYLFTLQPEGFKELDLPEGKSYADFNCLRWNGESKLETWKTPELIWFTNEFSQGDEKDGDFLKFRGGAPIITGNTKNLLTPIVKDNAEFLPVKIENETRYILNITCVLDVIDKEKSKFKIYGDGTIGPCQHAYINIPEQSNPIFKVTGFLPRIFVTDVFQETINQNKLSGCSLRPYINP